MKCTKRIISIILVLVLLVGTCVSGLVVPAAAKTANLFPNGDFEGFGETTPVYAPWTPFEASKNSTIATVKSGIGVDGSWGLEMGTASGAGYTQFASALTFEEGKTYRLSFMAKGATVAGNAALIQVYKTTNLTYINNSSKSVYLRPGKTVDDWVSYYTEFTAGANASWDASYSLLVNRGSDTGNIVFDNFVLEEVTEDTNRVTSGDFEKAYDRMFYEAIRDGKLEPATKATDTNAYNKAMKLLATETGWDSAWMKGMHLKSGYTYTISFDYIGGAFGMYASATHGEFENGTEFLSFGAADAWTHVQVSYDFFSSGSNDWAFSFLKRSSSKQNVADTYIDNIRIVKAPEATGIELDTTAVELEVGTEKTVSATFIPSGASTQPITWTSSDETVATVAGGKITAVAVGTATITATAGSLTATCAVTVKPSPIKGTEFTLADMAGHYKTQGRIYKTTSRLYLDWSASGFEFLADCSGDVYVKFQVGSIDATYGCYFTVLVDGVDQGRSACHITENGVQKIKIASDLPAGNHRFEIYRQSTMGSTVSIDGVILNGTLLDVPADNDLYIEFIGDSITVAQGNLWNSSIESTSNPLVTNATQGYAYITAHDKLGADFATIAVSGIGASVGWTNYNMQQVYPKLRYQKDSTTDYDFARQPDIVVLALGTNDMNRREYHGKTLDDIKQGFHDMLALVREKNPNAKVVWIHGMMLSSASSIIQEVVAEAGGADAGIYELRLTQNNKGGNGHPDTDGHISFANDLSAYIRQIMTPIATDITLDKTLAELEVGEDVTLTVTVKPEGAEVSAITWTSSDDTVATVVDGKVTAVKAGTATITAKMGELTATCTVTVKAAQPEPEPTPDPSGALYSESFEGTTAWKFDGNNVVAADDGTGNKAVTLSGKSKYLKSDEFAATIEAGKRYMLRWKVKTNGEAGRLMLMFYNKADGGYLSTYYDVTTTDWMYYQAAFTAQKDAETLEVGFYLENSSKTSDNASFLIDDVQVFEITPEFNFVPGGDMENTKSYWFNTYYNKTATIVTDTIEAGNKVLHVPARQTAIWYMFMGGAEDKVYEISFRYRGGKIVNWFSSSNSANYQNVGSTAASEEWTTFKMYVNTVSGATGNYFMIRTDSGNGSQDVYIDDVVVREIAMTMAETATVEKGATTTLTPAIAPADAQLSKFTWTSDNEAIATVVDGVVTGVAAGTATITATAGALTATCIVTVEVPDLSGIVLDKTAVTINIDGSVTLIPSTIPAGAELPTITWSSSDETVATVADGVVTGVAAGTATITAMAGDFVATCKVTVDAENLIVNGDFEQGASVSWGNIEYVKKGVGKDGSRGLESTRAEDNGDWNPGFGGFYKGTLLDLLRPNTTYVLSFDYKNTGNGQGQLYFARDFGTTSDGVKWKNTGFNLPAGEVDWTRLAYTFTTPSEICSTEPGWELCIRSWGKQGVSYYDNITLIELCSSHEYDHGCDATCNVCGAPRTTEHVYTNACDVDCNVCGEERVPSAHEYDHGCDKTCNVCGETRTTEHVYDNACDGDCNVCGDIRVPSAHEYDNACDADCNVCGEERVPSAHEYDHGCDQACNVCGETRTTEHVYDNACDTDCNVCGVTRTIKHTYSSNCDRDCNVCNETRRAPHTYSNACDDECNACGAIRIASEHKYTNNCDTTCNVCNAKRTIKHTYTNACDKSCNVCGATRTVPAHKYTNSCDTTCNVCNAKRTIKHTYTNACDKTCNVCGATRTTSHSYEKKVTKATLTANGKIQNVCKVCGYTASTSTTIYRPTSFKLSATSYTYNGAVKTPTVTVKDAAGKTISSSNYTVTYATGRKNAGTYSVKITMKGNYTGTKTLTFKINPISISKCKLSLSATTYTYDGKTKTPSVVVKNASGTKLTTSSYTVTYASGRKNVGTYKVTIKMKGNYSGTKTLTFKVNPAKTTVSKLTPATKSLKVSITKKSTQVTGYQVQYSTSKSFSSPKTVTISSYKTTSTTIKSLKAKTTYYVRVRTYKTVNGTKYYSGWSTVKYAKTK